MSNGLKMGFSDSDILFENEQNRCECGEVSEPGKRFPVIDDMVMCHYCLEDYRRDNPDAEAAIAKAEWREDR